MTQTDQQEHALATMVRDAVAKLTEIPRRQSRPQRAPAGPSPEEVLRRRIERAPDVERKMRELLGQEFIAAADVTFGVIDGTVYAEWVFKNVSWELYSIEHDAERNDTVFELLGGSKICDVYRPGSTTAINSILLWMSVGPY